MDVTKRLLRLHGTLEEIVLTSPKDSDCEGLTISALEQLEDMFEDEGVDVEKLERERGN